MFIKILQDIEKLIYKLPFVKYFDWNRNWLYERGVLKLVATYYQM